MYGYSLDVYSVFTQYIYQTCITSIHRLFVNGLHTFSVFIRYFASLKNLEPFLLWTSPSLGLVPRTETVSPTEKYIQTQTARFVKTFSEDTTQESCMKIENLRTPVDVVNYNSAIDPVFYSQKELADVLKNEANALEPHWRTKILVESTPRGNIVMFYDAFKQAFAYYTDQTSIPYPILNVVAMKYVILFRCRDFFVDEHVLPANVSSGITLAYALAEKEQKRAKKEKTTSQHDTKELLSDTKSAFVKFKSYNSVSSKANGYTPKSSENVSAKSNGEQTASPKLMNKHISLGKICNFSFIQKPKIKQTPTIESALMPKPRLSYAEYKRLAREL